jgi:deoxycytidylate deaminase/dephospho-CoA kinase
MASPRASSATVIGLTGSFGSGCTTFIADGILVKRGYKKISLSDILKEQYVGQKGDIPTTGRRRALQDFGDEMRKTKDEDYFAQEAIGRISKERKAGGAERWVVDSFKNPAEIHAFREMFTRFYLFGVCADEQTRWKRVETTFDGDYRAFKQVDTNDRGEDNDSYGQRVGDCFLEADIVISNDKRIESMLGEDFQELEGRVGAYAELAETPLTRRQPRREEMFMTMAYAASQRSSCMKRKVGAVIVVNETGTVVSSGFNEVPGTGRPCKVEFGKCHRQLLRERFAADLKDKALVVDGKEEELMARIRRTFRMLDRCRALHAEEKAIVGLARNGGSLQLEKCTLYCTTYPCRMCANKISDLGIGKVVYLEPYPDEEAKPILNGKDEFFEGVTSRGYFRVYGEEK